MPDTYDYLEQTIKAQQRRIEELEKQKATLREALRPFAEVIGWTILAAQGCAVKSLSFDASRAAAALRDTE